MIKQNNKLILASGLALLPFIMLALMGMIDEGLLWAVDRPVSLALFQLRTPAMNQVMKGITWLANGATITVAVLGIMALLYKRGFKKTALWYGLTLFIGAWVMMNAFKFTFQRLRPDSMYWLIDVSNYSFPSGHAINATLFFASLMLFTHWWVEGRGCRQLIYGLASLIIILIGFSRIYLGVHYLSDVVAGFSLATAYFLLSVSFHQKKIYTNDGLKEEYKDEL